MVYTPVQTRQNPYSRSKNYCFVTNFTVISLYSLGFFLKKPVCFGTYFMFGFIYSFMPQLYKLWIRFVVCLFVWFKNEKWYISYKCCSNLYSMLYEAYWGCCIMCEEICFWLQYFKTIKRSVLIILWLYATNVSSSGYDHFTF